ncbi:MAG: BMP family ABC transporter substrate-binding protein [Clostridiales bacterium]|nr:BMP family ABC transporter substrate-binding protein [Clostridiales bacterium]
MKKFLAVLLAMALLLSAVGALAEAINPNDIEDTMVSADGKYELGFVTDVGQLKDESFNQGTWNGVKAYAKAHGLSYKYYQPANGNSATDDDRYDAMKAACEGGAKVVVTAGFLQEAALRKAAAEFPEVSFIFIDGYPLKVESDDPNSEPVGLKNVAPIAFKEEQSGYFAGYAVVKEGFKKLGFIGGGGGTNPACCRFGYGFVQGANAAAKEMGVTVDMKYSWQYGASFSPSAELQTMMAGWYETGTEIVFSCGGNIFDSVAAAASGADAYVVGVDVDQSYKSEYVLTSATKGLVEATQWAIAKVYDGTFAEIGDVATSLGVENNAVGLPTETWKLENFSVEEYNNMYAKVVSGELVVDSSLVKSDEIKNVEFSNVKVDYE